jgi:hypothetical protein
MLSAKAQPSSHFQTVKYRWTIGSEQLPQPRLDHVQAGVFQTLNLSGSGWRRRLEQPYLNGTLPRPQVHKSSRHIVWKPR